MMEGEAEEVWEDGINGERRNNDFGESKDGENCKLKRQYHQIQ